MKALPGQRSCVAGVASATRCTLAVLGCVTLLAACVSNAPPMRFYVLTAAAGPAGAPSAAMAAQGFACTSLPPNAPPMRRHSTVT